MASSGRRSSGRRPGWSCGPGRDRRGGSSARGRGRCRPAPVACCAAAGRDPAPTAAERPAARLPASIRVRCSAARGRSPGLAGISQLGHGAGQLAQPGATDRLGPDHVPAPPRSTSGTRPVSASRRRQRSSRLRRRPRPARTRSPARAAAEPHRAPRPHPRPPRRAVTRPAASAEASRSVLGDVLVMALRPVLERPGRSGSTSAGARRVGGDTASAHWVLCSG